MKEPTDELVYLNVEVLAGPLCPPDVKARLIRMHPPGHCYMPLLFHPTGYPNPIYMGCTFRSDEEPQGWYYFAKHYYDGKDITVKGEIGGPFEDRPSAEAALQATCGRSTEESN